MVLLDIINVDKTQPEITSLRAVHRILITYGASTKQTESCEVTAPQLWHVPAPWNASYKVLHIREFCIIFNKISCCIF